MGIGIAEKDGQESGKESERSAFPKPGALLRLGAYGKSQRHREKARQGPQDGGMLGERQANENSTGECARL